MPDESTLRTNSTEAMSHQFGLSGYLSYFNKVFDGFYLIPEKNPYAQTIFTDFQESSCIPSIESLRFVLSAFDSSIEVILIDRHDDTSLKELQDGVLSISSSCITMKEVFNKLAKLVFNHMGVQPPWEKMILF